MGERMGQAQEELEVKRNNLKSEKNNRVNQWIVDGLMSSRWKVLNRVGKEIVWMKHKKGKINKRLRSKRNEKDN